jgi:hypothetical protein
VRKDGSVEPARALALEWLSRRERLPGLAEAREAVVSAADMPLLRAALRRHLAGPLGSVARRAGMRAAVESGDPHAVSGTLILLLTG